MNPSWLMGRASHATKSSPPHTGLTKSVPAGGRLQVGHGFDAGVSQGPLINKAGMQKSRAHVDASLALGAPCSCKSLWAVPAAAVGYNKAGDAEASLLQPAVPMDNPYCSCSPCGESLRQAITRRCAGAEAIVGGYPLVFEDETTGEVPRIPSLPLPARQWACPPPGMGWC